MSSAPASSVLPTGHVGKADSIDLDHGFPGPFTTFNLTMGAGITQDTLIGDTFSQIGRYKINVNVRTLLNLTSGAAYISLFLFEHGVGVVPQSTRLTPYSIGINSQNYAYTPISVEYLVTNPGAVISLFAAWQVASGSPAFNARAVFSDSNGYSTFEWLKISN